VEVRRDVDTGVWVVEASEDERALKAHYLLALPRFLTAFDSLAHVAKSVDEAQFVLALLGVRGMQDAGWDPFETTIEAIKAATRLHNETDDRTASRHLQLWIYGHIVEASVPYELLGNLARIAIGEPAVMDPFQDLGGRPSPGAKIAAIAQWADAAGNQAVGFLLHQIWDRELRNAIFHSDYSLHGAEIRIPGLGLARSLQDMDILTGKATAYHDGVLGVRRYHLESYTEPKRVRAGAISGANPDEELLVIVREGEGAIGLKDALTAQERARGGIAFRYAKLYPGERSMLDGDPDLALLPARLEHRSESGTDPGAD
jgi:hypothetical protein